MGITIYGDNNLISNNLVYGDTEPHGDYHSSETLNLQEFLEKLIPQVKGRIGIRSWGINKGKLQSTSRDIIWSKIMIADEIPSKNNDNGLYAYSTDNFINEQNNIIGLVELRGKILEHEDGVLRGEWARILCIFCLKESDYRILTKQYPDTHVYYGHLR